MDASNKNRKVKHRWCRLNQLEPCTGQLIVVKGHEPNNERTTYDQFISIVDGKMMYLTDIYGNQRKIWIPSTLVWRLATDEEKNMYYAC